MMATTLLVVPRSIPMIFAMIQSLLSKRPGSPEHGERAGSRSGPVGLRQRMCHVHGSDRAAQLLVIYTLAPYATKAVARRQNAVSAADVPMLPFLTIPLPVSFTTVESAGI